MRPYRKQPSLTTCRLFIKDNRCGIVKLPGLVSTRQRADSIRKTNGDTSKSTSQGQRSGGIGNWKYLKDAMYDLVKYPPGFDSGSEYSPWQVNDRLLTCGYAGNFPEYTSACCCAVTWLLSMDAK